MPRFSFLHRALQCFLVLGLASLLACSGGDDDANNNNGQHLLNRICEGSDAPATCGSACDEEDTPCPNGFYCRESSQTCTADCDENLGCGDGFSCDIRAGRCISVSANNNGDSCDAIVATIRDFRGANEDNGHPDFEAFGGNAATPGIVKADLGADNLPVWNYDNIPAKPFGEQQSGVEADFNQWYRDTPGVNLPFTFTFPLSENGVFEDNEFFPLDDEPNSFGLTPGRPHNYHFTTEVHTRFTYEQAKNLTFGFRGDDDLWIFVNGKLALDLGGLHPVVEGEINFNERAEDLGLVDGQTYPMDIFHAERHTVESNFRVATNIQCFRSGLVLQ